MAKFQRKAILRRDKRINAWMASKTMQAEPRAFRKPGSLK
jgi:hypothetical protein